MLYKPGVIDDMLVGVVWERDISQLFVTGALTSVGILALMILLSTALPARANRATNRVVASPVGVCSAVVRSETSLV